MSYTEKYREIADRLWVHMGKGSLFNSEGEIKAAWGGWSSGEHILWKVSAAIADPGNHQMPPLDEIAHKLDRVRQLKILNALNEMFSYEA